MKNISSQELIQQMQEMWTTIERYDKEYDFGMYTTPTWERLTSGVHKAIQRIEKELKSRGQEDKPAIKQQDKLHKDTINTIKNKLKSFNNAVKVMRYLMDDNTQKSILDVQGELCLGLMLDVQDVIRVSKIDDQSKKRIIAIYESIRDTYIQMVGQYKNRFNKEEASTQEETKHHQNKEYIKNKVADFLEKTTGTTLGCLKVEII